MPEAESPITTKGAKSGWDKRIRSAILIIVFAPLCLMGIFLVVQVAFDPSLLTSRSSWEQMFTGEPGHREMLALFDSIDEDFDPETLDETLAQNYVHLMRGYGTAGEEGYITAYPKYGVLFSPDYWLLILEFDDDTIERAMFRHLDDPTMDLPGTPEDKVFVQE